MKKKTIGVVCSGFIGTPDIFITKDTTVIMVDIKTISNQFGPEPIVITKMPDLIEKIFIPKAAPPSWKKQDNGRGKFKPSKHRK